MSGPIKGGGGVDLRCTTVVERRNDNKIWQAELTFIHNC